MPNGTTGAVLVVFLFALGRSQPYRALTAKLGLQCSCNKVPEKRLQRGYHMWFYSGSRTAFLHRVQKRGWWKGGYRTATVCTTNAKERTQSMNFANIVAVMTFLHAIRNLFLTVSPDHMFGSNLWRALLWPLRKHMTRPLPNHMKQPHVHNIRHPGLWPKNTRLVTSSSLQHTADRKGTTRPLHVSRCTFKRYRKKEVAKEVTTCYHHSANQLHGTVRGLKKSEY